MMKKEIYTRQEVIDLIYDIFDIDNFIVEKCNIINLGNYIEKYL